MHRLGEPWLCVGVVRPRVDGWMRSRSDPGSVCHEDTISLWKTFTVTVQTLGPSLRNSSFHQCTQEMLRCLIVMICVSTVCSRIPSRLNSSPGLSSRLQQGGVHSPQKRSMEDLSWWSSTDTSKVAAIGKSKSQKAQPKKTARTQKFADTSRPWPKLATPIFIEGEAVALMLS